MTEAQEDDTQPIDAPENTLILEIQEQATSLADDNSNRNLTGTDDGDIFSKQDLENGSNM